MGHGLAHGDRGTGDGIARAHIHTYMGKRRSGWRRRIMDDPRHRLERWFWNGNLALFFLALALFIYGLWASGATWSMVGAAVMAVTLAIGLVFLTLPDTHLEAFRSALSHGEVLVMVDIPKARVGEVETRVRRHHPEATLGGVGWKPGRPRIAGTVAGARLRAP
jgi:hypothetical protein